MKKEITNEDLAEAIAKIDGRFDGIEAKFSNLETKFSGLEIRLIGVENKVRQLDDTVDTLAMSTSKGFADMDLKFDILAKEVFRHSDILDDIQMSLRSHQGILVDHEHRLKRLEG